MSNVVRRSFVAALVVTVLGALPALAAASSIESEIELLRSDLKAGKVEIVKEAMHIEGARADAFWPVYRKYQLELDAIGDKRVALIKEYAASYDSMTDAKAKSLVKQALDLQSARTSLLKKYYGNFEKVLGAVDAAKLVQVEHLIMAAIDLQLASEMPLIEKTAPAASKP
jgi:hypothetical protein